jgi:hypothetical protein
MVCIIISIHVRCVGGCNTVLDSLHLGQLVLTRPQSHWYNRIGTAIIRAVLPETISKQLIAYDEYDYIERILQWCTQPLDRFKLTQELRQHIQMSHILEYRPHGIKVKSHQTQYPTEASYFPRAIDYLRQHHNELHELATERRRIGHAPYVLDLATEWNIRTTPLTSEGLGADTQETATNKVSQRNKPKKNKKKKQKKTGDSAITSASASASPSPSPPSPPPPDEYFSRVERGSRSKPRVKRKNRPSDRQKDKDTPAAATATASHDDL